MSNRSSAIIIAGSLFMASSVSAGAFGAHALKETLSAYSLNIYDTAIEYAFYHSLGLLLLGVLERIETKLCHSHAALLMATGILLFSGSLIMLSLSGIRWLGMITPVGGVLFIVAWLLLANCYWRTRSP